MDEILSRAELVAHAGSERRARTLVAQGDWWRVCHDAYAPLVLADSPEVRLRALSRVVPAGVAVSHRTALWLLGVDVAAADLHLTAARGHRLAHRSGVRPHSALLPDSELCDVAGLLSVSGARAVVDVLRSESLVEGVVVADAALRAGVATPRSVELAVHASAGLRGVERARAALPHVEPRSESPQESRLRLLLVQGGLPRPRAQVDVYDEDGHVARLDLELAGVALEFDGRRERLSRERFASDRRRQNRLADLGVELRRFTAYDLRQRPAAAVCADVQRAGLLAAGRDRSRVRTGPDTLRPPRRTPLPTRAELAARDQGTARRQQAA